MKNFLGIDKELNKVKNDFNYRVEFLDNKYEEQSKAIKEINEREEWARNRFEEQSKAIKEINEREEWTRNKINKIEQMLETIAHGDKSVDSIFAWESFSQSGEDAIINYIFNFVGIGINEVNYLDLGANHAIKMSNSYGFYKNGASGVLVEANPELIPELQKIRERDNILNVAISLSNEESIDFFVLSGDGLSTIDEESALAACKSNPEIYIKSKYLVRAMNINDILDEYFAQKNIHMMSIDLEGIELEILNQINYDKYRPLVIIVEDIPYKPHLVIDSKIGKAKELLEKKGYVEYAFTGINSIYLDREYIESFNKKIIFNKQGEIYE